MILQKLVIIHFKVSVSIGIVVATFSKVDVLIMIMKNITDFQVGGKSPNTKRNYRLLEKMMSLFNYERDLPYFSKVFSDVDASEVIQAMDKAGDDIANQSPEHLIELPSVGIERHNIPVQVQDPFDEKKTTILHCDVSLSTYVPPQKRGIHMSRIGDLIAKQTEEKYKDLQHYALCLAQKLSQSQYNGSSQVHVRSTYSYLEHISGWISSKDKKSLEHIGLQASATVDSSQQTQNAGITVTHLTACPCVQETYKHALLQTQGQITQAIETISPLLTHSQRSKTTIEIGNLSASLSIKKLLNCLDQVIFRTQNTLPREYELLMVYRAHQNPQFIEDALRQILSALYDDFQNEFKDSVIKIDSYSMESIHDFDLRAQFSIPFQQIKKSKVSRVC